MPNFGIHCGVELDFYMFELIIEQRSVFVNKIIILKFVYEAYNES